MMGTHDIWTEARLSTGESVVETFFLSVHITSMKLLSENHIAQLQYIHQPLHYTAVCDFNLEGPFTPVSKERETQTERQTELCDKSGDIVYFSS